MKETLSVLGTVLATALALAGTTAGCGSSKPAGDGGAGGGAGGQGNGGVTGAGGTGGSGGGTGGAGSGGFDGIGGRASGGIGTGGSGSGGIGGTGGRASGGAGAGGSGSGGRATGGAGGSATGGSGGGAGGSTSLDAGCTGAGCALDAGQSDAPWPSCSQITTQSACDLRADCHSVFRDAAGCGCDGGACCVQFNRCVEGGQADCTGSVSCEMLTPSCPAPYVLSYTANCYEGCVHQSACPTPTCPATAPASATTCGPVDYTCFYESCSTTGRTLATCAGGKWKVETAACTSITCAGGGITPGSLTCATGQVCVVQTNIGGAYIVTPMCVQPTCGAGPISLSCIPSSYGSCTLTYGLSGVIVRCSSSSCGSGQGGCA